MVENSEKELEEFNKQLRMNGLPSVTLGQLKDIKTFKKAVVLEDERVKKAQHLLVERLVQIVTLAGTAIAYWFASKAVTGFFIDGSF